MHTPRAPRATRAIVLGGTGAASPFVETSLAATVGSAVLGVLK
ncbi:MAG: hypothetical protein ACYC6C_07960 [Coriobacteriia bacterium]